MKKFIIIPLMIIISACSNKADNNIDNNLSLNIYHFNDIHSAETFNMPLTIDNESVSAKAGGYPRFIEALSNSDKPAYTEVIFAGDMFQQGYPLFTYTNGKYDFDMLCMSSPDIITLGNHELYETDTGILNLFLIILMLIMITAALILCLQTLLLITKLSKTVLNHTL